MRTDTTYYLIGTLNEEGERKTLRLTLEELLERRMELEKVMITHMIRFNPVTFRTVFTNLDDRLLVAIDGYLDEKK